MLKQGLFVCLAACAAPSALPGEPGQQLVTGHGKADGETSNDPHPINCQLEYETFAQPFDAVPAATISTTLGDVINNSASAADARYGLELDSNPNPATNLSFIATISNVTTQQQVAYVVAPAPQVGGAFLFELGGGIATVNLPGSDGTQRDFDHVRAYCSITNPQ